MRPVALQYKDSQQFGSGATAGVVANSSPNSGMGYYVWLYGNYQPFGHAGLDIATPIGTPIHAIADGTVLYAGWSEDLPGTGNIRKWLFYYNFGGIITVIQHKGWISVVAHQSNNNHVKVGDSVKEGQLIGLSGNTKTRTTYVAAHVHVEALVYLDYRSDVRNGIIYGRVDPKKFFGTLAVAGTPEPQKEDEIPLSAVDTIMAQLHQMVEWDHGRFKVLEGQINLTLNVLSKIAPQFTFYKAPDDGTDESKTLYELADGRLRGITNAEWQARGGFAPTELPQADIDTLLKAGT